MFPDDINLFVAVPSGSTCSVLFSVPGQKHWHRPRPDEFYLSYGDLGICLSKVLLRWFEHYERIDIVSQLAASVLTSENLWPHVEFLSLMHVLEGFHRSLFAGLYMPSEAYQDIKNALNAAIPSGVSSSHRSALQSRIAYGNESSLRRRLNELAKKLSERVRKRIFGKSGTVPGQWIDTRNFYSHWGPNSKANLLEKDDLIHANLRMRHFLRALYLELLQVPEDAIQRGVFGSSNDARLLSQISQ